MPDAPDLRLPLLRLGEWMRRIGAKVSEQPQLHWRVQPVTVISDASALTPAWLAPAAIVGGVFAALAGQFAAFCVQGRAAGGCYVRDLRWSGSGVWSVGLLAAPGATGATSACVPYQMAPDPLQSVAQFESLIADPYAGTETAAVQLAGTSSLVMGDVFHVPAGQWLVVCNQAAALQFTSLCCVVQDVPAGPLS